MCPVLLLNPGPVYHTEHSVGMYNPIQHASTAQQDRLHTRDYLNRQPPRLAVSISNILNSVYCPGIPHIYWYDTA